MTPASEILRCPSTGRALSLDAENYLLRAESGPAYSYADGVGRFLEPVTDADANKATRTFYDQVGWSKDASGLYQDTAKFVDTRPASLAFTRACMRRLKKHFRKGGKFLLDAGSGPIAHDELLEYGDAFEKRVCVDLSVPALLEAKRKLGDRGIYLQGDLTNLPVETDSIDTAMCYHVIYQLPEELQAKAFNEIWRVLKPGGAAVVIYCWPNPKLAWRIERLAKMLLGSKKPSTEQAAAQAPAAKPDHNPLTLEWFQNQPWPFRYSFDTYRVVSNYFLKNSIPSNWRGALFLKGLMLLQRMAPSYCGKYGDMPAIIIHKDAK
jgi:ubiquinone/menaquinone biosynthesis C-methylase UbiE